MKRLAEDEDAVAGDVPETKVKEEEVAERAIHEGARNEHSFLYTLCICQPSLILR
jgi:hypothetical protein